MNLPPLEQERLHAFPRVALAALEQRRVLRVQQLAGLVEHEQMRIAGDLRITRQKCLVLVVGTEVHLEREVLAGPDRLQLRIGVDEALERVASCTTRRRLPAGCAGSRASPAPSTVRSFAGSRRIVANRLHIPARTATPRSAPPRPRPPANLANPDEPRAPCEPVIWPP